MKGGVKLGQSWNAGCVDCKTACQGMTIQLEIILTDEHGMDHDDFSAVSNW